MAQSIPIPFDFLTRPVRFVKEDRVYSIIVAEGAYAGANTDPAMNVTVVETDTDPSITGRTTATLLESSSSAGADFAAIDITGVSPENVQRIYCLVVPRSEEARTHWYDMYVVPISGSNAMPTAPFLWQTTSMTFREPRLVRFKIRHEPHIVGPGPQGSVPMVQMYPATDAAIGQFGWSVLAYRTDIEGTGQLFQSPPAWHTDVIDMFGGIGLLFGKDPPLIAADVPFT